MRLILVTLILTLCADAMASTFRRKLSRRSYFDVKYSQLTYSDLTIGGSDARTSVPLHQLEFGLRFYRLFSTYLNMSYATDQQVAYDYSQITGVGMGFRADIPGFFFLWGIRPELNRKSKTYPLSTYSYVGLNMVNYTFLNEKATDLSMEWGLGIDLFLYSPDLYLHVGGGLATVGGNTFITNRVGVGWEW